MINEVGFLDDKLNVVMIIHLQFASGYYIGFPCEPWRSVHIDTISPQQPMMIRFMSRRSIFQIVKAEVEDGV